MGDLYRVIDASTVSALDVKLTRFLSGAALLVPGCCFESRVSDAVRTRVR